MKSTNQSQSKCCSANKKPSLDEGSVDQNALDNAIEVPAGSCCGGDQSTVAKDSSSNSSSDCCPSQTQSSVDWILWTCLPLVIAGYGAYLAMFVIAGEHDHHQPLSVSVMPDWLMTMSHTTFEMVNAMWWGILSAAFFVGLLGRIPRELVMSVLGKGGSKRGIFRATLAGVMLDLCNHGILMVAMKLYERGASIGQVVAFLVASPWNSLTLTLILVGLIGLPLTLLFIVASLIIAWISGYIFDLLVQNQTLPANNNAAESMYDAVEPPSFGTQLKAIWRKEDWSFNAMVALFWHGLKESKMVLRWVVFGVVLVALIRAFVPVDQFELWFGATLSGLLLTLVATTIIEVCSEGSSPIAADLVNRAHAPGNAFTFLMAGAATDYTEIMSVKETTGSWKIALFIPLITVPQVLFISWLMNTTL